MTFNEFKIKFDAEVNTSHIEYDQDAGHTYSSINHPLMIYTDYNDEFLDYANDWLSNNDDCASHPCRPGGECGCNPVSEDKRVG